MRELQVVELVLEENIRRVKALGSAFTLSPEYIIKRKELLAERKFIVDEIRQINDFEKVLFGAKYMHVKIKRGIDIKNDLEHLERDWIALDIYGHRNIIDMQNKPITYEC